MMPSLVYDVKEVRTFRELLENSAALYGGRTAFLFKDKATGNVRTKTYQEAFSDAAGLATYFLSKGYKNKRIAVMGHNCYEWAVTYLAVTTGCGVIVPVDKELKAPDVENILKVSEAALIVHTPELGDVIDRCGGSFDRLSTDALGACIDEGKALLAAGDKSYDNYTIDPYDMSILLFTSGTTGMAKGVMLSQYNICADIVSIRKGLYVSPEDRVLSILPLHHTYECTAGFLAVLYSGASIAYAENLRRILNDLQLFAPTILITVPLLLENIHANIKKKAAAAKGGRLKFATGKAVANTAAALRIDVKKKLFKQIHEIFGGRLEKIICGAAALSPEIAADFDTFGIPVLNGYGLTETSPVCIMHNDSYRDYDSIGRPISGVEVRLDSVNEEGIGEIVIKGPNVMLGYYQNPEETARVLADGWFYTGDLGTVDAKGCYRIVGRIKNMIVTKNGKKIFPEEMEYLLGKSPYIKESMVYGDETPEDVLVTAVIYPDFEAVDARMAEQGVTPGTERYNAELKALLSAAVKEVNATVPNYKMIRRFLIRYTEFEKTTTRKIRRNSAENRKGE